MKTVHIGLGFATGRKSFRKVLNAYLSVWNATRSRLPLDMEVRLHLFVAYDLEYHNTRSTDYTNLSQELVDAFDSMIFYGAKNALRSIEQAALRQDFTSEELRRVFAAGYAGKRNAVLFAALENHMDYLLFLDDDEYPMAVTNNRDFCLWSGQNVILSHLREIPHADYTNGYHCGYVSPIPQIAFNDVLDEGTFRTFIEAISNDIVNWEKMKSLMATGGVTYADTEVLLRQTAREVPEVGGCKFLSGANLCINLTRPERTFPFYNPPGAPGGGYLPIHHAPCAHRAANPLLCLPRRLFHLQPAAGGGASHSLGPHHRQLPGDCHAVFECLHRLGAVQAAAGLHHRPGAL